MNYPHFLIVFGAILTFLTIIYCWLINSLLVFRIIKGDKYKKDYYEPVSIIIPCYNEEPKFLKECIESCINADGIKEIILVNNNSNKQSCINMINELKNNPNIRVFFEKRQGKRFAHSCGLKHSKYKLVVFIDSDTIINKDTLLNLVKPMQDEKIGACCGNIKIKNTDKFLTKCLDTMYWNSFEFYRYATSSLGYLYVCSGALSCYRKELILKLENEYLNQEFMGVKCSISDDTFATVRIQSRFGKKVAYCCDAIAYTYSPDTFKGFWKQLLRWRQGFLRESLLMWKEPKKNIKFLFIDAQYNLFIQTTIVFMRMLFLIELIFNFSAFNLIFYLIFFLVSSLLLSAYQIICRPSKFVYIFCYSLIYDFIFVFTIVHAYVEIKHQGTWGTR